MEGVNELEQLAAQAAAEDVKPEVAQPAGAVAGDHLPADVERLRYEKAGQRAVQLVGLLEWAVKQKDDRLSLPESAYKDAAPRLAPLIVKHGLDEYGLPEWLLPYREEIAALVYFVGIGAGVGLQLWQLREQDAAAAQAAAEAAGQRQPAGAPTGNANPMAWAADTGGLPQ